MPAPATKRCTLCGQEKSIEAFNRKSGALDDFNSWCRECNRANLRAWTSQNPARKIALNARWYRRNVESVKIRVRGWRDANQALHNHHNRMRRALKNNAPGQATLAQVEARIAFYGFRCAYCDGPNEHVWLLT